MAGKPNFFFEMKTLDTQKHTPSSKINILQGETITKSNHKPNKMKTLHKKYGEGVPGAR